MFKRRLLAALAALLLAGAGAALLTNYVKGADGRAMAGMETANVLVVTALIPKATAAEALGKRVELKELPAKAVADGAVASVSEISGQVSTADLQPGEQVLGSRFADPATLPGSGELKIPAGLQQLSFAVERSRMVGSKLTAGTTAGVFISLPKDGDRPAQTHLVLQKVLVTQVGDGDAAAPPGDDGAVAAPADLVMVTVAVDARDAEKMVFGAEHGRLWLSAEPSDATTSGTQVVTPGNVFK